MSGGLQGKGRHHQEVEEPRGVEGGAQGDDEHPGRPEQLEVLEDVAEKARRRLERSLLLFGNESALRLALLPASSPLRVPLHWVEHRGADAAVEHDGRQDEGAPAEPVEALQVADEQWAGHLPRADAQVHERVRDAPFPPEVVRDDGEQETHLQAAADSCGEKDAML